MNQKRKVTIREVAREAGVSINTVSRALNGKPDVSEATRRKVLDVTKRLGYRPNKLAKGLRSNKTGTIGVVVTDVSNPYFSALVKSVEEAARQHNYSLILQDTNEDPEQEREAILTLLAERVDGVLLTPTQKGKEAIAQLQESGLPFVLLGRRYTHLRTDYVVTDDVSGGFLATEHLIRLKRERIAIITGPLCISSAKERLQGYMKAFAQYGIEVDESLVVKADAITAADGYRTMQALLRRPPYPTAVFAYSDFVAFGVMKAIREAGLRIPQDVAVVGYDDVEFCSYLETPLSSVRIPKEELGKTAAEGLIRKLTEGAEDPLKVSLPVSLIVRTSSQAEEGERG